MKTNVNLAVSIQSAAAVDQMTDAELLAGTRRLVGRSNQLLAELLAHLAEVETRGIHRARACSSLYTYCIYELRLSEDEAFRRVAAARLVRRFPALIDAVASGELHLTGLLMLGPHLTEANLVEVLARAKHRTKRELSQLVRILDPLPAVPARIEPLGPAPARVITATPSWETIVRAARPVRELPPGERPRDWVPAANELGRDPSETTQEPAPDAELRDASPVQASLPAPARVGSTVSEPLQPVQYKVQFTATEEYVRLVEEAKALLSHAVPGLTLEELQLRAMRSLVSELNKRKYAAQNGSPGRGSAHRPAESQARVLEGGSRPLRPRDQVAEKTNPRQRGRHIPAHIRRTVFERDGARCTFVDDTQTRCAETHRLEFHHLKPFAAGGEHAAHNLTLRCAAHNTLAAEEDFGRELIEARKDSSCHEPFRDHGRP